MHWLSDFRFIIVVAVSAGWYGYQEATLWWDCGGQPQEVTLFELTQESVNSGNRHVCIYDYELAEDYVYLDEDDDGEFEEIEIPLLTLQGNFTKRPVIARYYCPPGATEYLFDDPLVGVVTSGVKGIDIETRSLLKSRFPDVSFDDPLVIEVNRSLPNPLLFVPALGVGLASIGWGCVVGLRSMVA
ncbi:hypothetical protein AB1L30_08165 [Bremerella sp. JC817]|uniref:hypothetical protein n=1 Tax=Bremerella sp. JC817 TaxID=3231756 RepID=UPI0034599111